MDEQLRLEATHDLVLRTAREDDLDVLAAILTAPEVARWWGPFVDTELAEEVLTPPAEMGSLAIELEGRVVGYIQFWEEPQAQYRHAGIDIVLSPEVHGRGLGPVAVQRLARYLIDERGHHRLTIDPAADNARAIATYRKVGFRPVGVMRRYERGLDGTFHDGLLMDLLADELVR